MTGNLKKFHETLMRAYKEANGKHKVPRELASTFESLNQNSMVQDPVTKKTVLIWKLLRRRTARLYWHDQQLYALGLFDFELNWEDIYAWILDNLIPILKICLMLLPLLIM